MIAALKAGRNCVCIEKDALLFINAKIRAIDVLNKSTQTEDADEHAQENCCN